MPAGKPYVTIDGKRMGVEEAMRKYKPNVLQRALVSLSRTGKNNRRSNARTRRLNEVNAMVEETYRRRGGG